MEPIRRREKDRPMLGTSYQPTSTPKQHQTSTFDHKHDLLIALTPLITILLAFGGKLSVLVMCFGGLLCYICDLIGSVEGTITTLILTLLGEVACLVWAARVFLSESMLNFSVIVLMWVVLFFSFLVSCNFFVGIVNEVGIVLGAMNQLMFAALPLLSAALISWFLCVEIPSFDLLLCFNAVYFVYVLFLGKPREIASLVKKSGKSSPTTPSSAPVRVILPPYILLLMYIIPIVMTVCMHVALHHNVLSTHHTRVTNFLMSLLVPCLLMVFCAYKQLARPALDFHSEDASFFANLPRYLDFSTLVLSALFVWCLDRHPIMDEIKSFSELDDEMAGYAIMVAVGLVFAAFAIHRFTQTQTRLLAEQSENINTDGAMRDARKKLKFISILASICIGGANALLAIVIGLPDHAIGVSVVGAMALSEYYLHPDWSFSSKCILVTIASLYSALAAASFMKMALQGIDYNFQWHVDVTLQHFTTLVNVLVPVAIALPTMVTHGTVRGAGEVLYSAASLGILPDAQVTSTGGSGGALPLGNRAFEFAFPAVCALVAGAELMFREQDWSDIRVSVAVVYPLYYFIGTSFIVTATSTLMYSAKTIGPSCVWILWVTQGCKLLHLVGVTSIGALTSCLLLLAYTLPFIRVVSRYLRMEGEVAVAVGHGALGGKVGNTVKSSATSAVNLLELVLYVAIATVATYWSGQHGIAHNILESILLRDPTDLQQTTLCLAVWLAYLGCILLVFYKPHKTLRSAVLVTAGLCLLIAMEGFGHLNLTFELTSSKYLTIALHPDMHVQEHPALFLALSTALSALTWIGLIPLNNLFMCVLYSLLFGFISSKAMLGWAFPLSLAADSFTHHIFAFPFVYLYICKFLLTLVAVWNPALNSKQGQPGGPKNASSIVTKGALVLACAIPFFGLLWAISTNVYPQAHTGIEWSAVVGFATLCCTTRLREVYNDSTLSGMSGKKYDPSGRDMSACIPCATLTLFFMSMAVLTTHGLDRDIYIPLSSLAFLCSTPGAVMPGKAPVVVVGAICAAFWTLSALYAVLVKGYGVDARVLEFEGPQDMFHLDSDVSIWTNDSTLWPIINLLLVLAPMPGVISGIFPQVGKSEDIIFVLAVLSLVPVFAAQISSLRYLGILGMLFAAWKGYRVSDLQHRSDRLI